MGSAIDFERAFVMLLLALLAALSSEREVDGRGTARAPSTAAEDPETDFDRLSNIVRTPNASATEAEKLFRGFISSSSASEIGLTRMLSRVTEVEARDSERVLSVLPTLDQILS
jgi:hypothetical protein